MRLQDCAMHYSALRKKNLRQTGTAKDYYCTNLEVNVISFFC